jgi:hypothetical protein
MIVPVQSDSPWEPLQLGRLGLRNESRIPFKFSSLLHGGVRGIRFACCATLDPASNATDSMQHSLDH